MTTPKYKGEVTIRLGGLGLDLQYKTRNLMVLTDITGKAPLEFVQQFQSADEDNEVLLRNIGNPSFIVPIITAGCAHLSENRKLNVDKLQEKIEDLLDKEIDDSDKSPLEVMVLLGSQVLMPFVCSIQGISEIEGKPVKNWITESQKQFHKAPRKSSAGKKS
jgi:hypothetical protein